MKYRQKFHLSWEEAMKVPIHVMQKDLEMMSIENQMLQSKQDFEARKLKK